jgi:ribonuclease HII
MIPDGWKFERRATDEGFASVAGVDEAGRGPLAGPVVAAAVILPHGFDVPGVNDSKKLSANRRKKLFFPIYEHALAVGVGVVGPARIDQVNILQASLLAMSLAVQSMQHPADFLLIDGPFRIPLSLPQKPITQGDRRSISIAAASIIAKVTRDQLMVRYHHLYPAYGFSGHKGYPTQKHRVALQHHGSCPIHRRSFKGVI